MILRSTAARIMAAFCLLLLHATRAAAQKPPLTLDDPDIALLYPLSQQVHVMAEICQRDMAGQSAGVPAALAGWNQRHGRQQLDSLVNAVARRRAAMGRSLLRMSGVSLLGADPAAACGDFGSYISTAQFDLSVANPQALRDALRKLGVPPATVIASAGSTQRAGTDERPPQTPDTPPADSAAEPAPVEISAARAQRPGTDAPRGGPKARAPATVRNPRTTSRTARDSALRATASAGPVASAGAPVPRQNSEPPEVEIGPAPSQPPRAADPTPPTVGRTPPPLAAAMPEGRRITSLSEVTGPAGWQKKIGTDGGVVFTNPPTDSGPVSLIIYPDQQTGNAPLDTALQRFLVRSFSSKLSMADEFKYGGPRLAWTSRGQRAAYADIDPDFHDSRNGLSIVAVAIARGTSSFTPVLLISKDDHFQYDHKRTFAKWFATAMLPGDAGPLWSLSANARPGQLRGLWMGTSMTNVLNLYGGLDLIANRHYATFYQNGIVYSELPDGGAVDSLDFARVCTKDPTDCGTYRVEGKRLITQFPNDVGLIQTDTSELKNPADPQTEMTFDGENLFKVAPVKPMRLNGDYTSIAGSSSGPNGSFTRVRTIVFYPDGRYESTGSVGFTATPGGLSSDNGSVVGYVPGSEKTGNYSIEGFTLTLRPNVGPVRYATIVFFDNERPVTSMLIDDEYFKR